MSAIGPLPGGVTPVPRSSSPEPLKSMALGPAIMMLAHLNTEERIQFMQMSRGNYDKIRKLTENETRELVNIKNTVLTVLGSIVNESEREKLDEVFENPEFNHLGLSFEDRQKMLRAELYNILENKIEDPAYSADISNNKELMLNLVKHNGMLLERAPLEFKSDPEFIKAALQQNGMALMYASEEQKKDPEIVRVAVAQDGLTLRLASPEMRSNFEIVSLAVANHPYALQFASDELRGNSNIVRIAVARNGLALNFALGEAKKDRGVVEIALNKNGLALEYVEEPFLSDLDIVKIAVRNNGMALQYASKNIKGSPEVISIAVANDSYAIQFASFNQMTDHQIVEIVKIALSQDIGAYYLLPIDLQKHPKILALWNG